MDERPLGSWTSWLADGAIGGASMPAAAFLGAVSWFLATEDGATTHRVCQALLLLVLVGGGIGAAVAPGLWWASTRCWRWAPLAGFALGPLVGAVGTLVLVYTVELLFTGRWLDARWWHLVMLASAGGSAVGPPWAAYLAVRSRSKRGLGVVGAAVVWAGTSGFAFAAAVSLL